MAEGKKSFVLYCDLIDNIDHLTNEEKGVLFQHLLEYVNDMKPVLEDRVILSAWKFIKSQLNRDLVKFEEIKEKRSLAGKESARQRALKKSKQNKNNSTNSTSVKSVQHSSTNPTGNVNENVNVNDNEIIDKSITTKDKKTDADVLADYKTEIGSNENQMWREQFYMKMRYNTNCLSRILDDFIIDFKIREHKPPKNLKEFKQHFLNWVNVQDRLEKYNKYKIVKKTNLGI